VTQKAGIITEEATTDDTENVALETKYIKTLDAYLSKPDEGLLLDAYELGRAALIRGLGVLEIASLHSRALAMALSRPTTDDEKSRLLENQTNFFVEVLCPFEMAHRGFRDANGILRRLNELLESQAKRIAFSLHDEASQLLAAVHISLAEATHGLPPKITRRFDTVKDLMGQIEDRLRSLSHELSPPILLELGLCPALEVLADGVARRWGFAVTVKSSLHADIPPTVQTSVYRITQEALTNVAKHAAAGRAEIELRQTAHSLVCSVRDDGIGFDSNPISREVQSGLGLMEIRERVAALGGTLRLHSQQNHGTDLTVEIPLEN
jgi:signal transduction histidine kinase